MDWLFWVTIGESVKSCNGTPRLARPFHGVAYRGVTTSKFISYYPTQTMHYFLGSFPSNFFNTISLHGVDSPQKWVSHLMTPAVLSCAVFFCKKIGGGPRNVQTLGTIKTFSLQKCYPFCPSSWFSGKTTLKMKADYCWRQPIFH